MGGKDMAIYKVIGKGQDRKYFDDNALNEVISYIFRPNKIPSRYIGGYGVHLKDSAEQMNMVAILYGKNHGVRLRHSVLSFEEKEHISHSVANMIADSIALYYAPEYQIVYAVHEDTDTVHIHFVMNQVSYTDGHKYSGSKQEYYDFINYMRNIGSEYGIKIKNVSDEPDYLFQVCYHAE